MHLGPPLTGFFLRGDPVWCILPFPLQARQLVNDLKTQGLLPEGVTLEKVRQCIYGRLNTHLYEYRPKVSDINNCNLRCGLGKCRSGEWSWRSQVPSTC